MERLVVASRPTIAASWVFNLDPDDSQVRTEPLASYDFLDDLPSNDATPEGLRRLREVNALLRTVPWPAPFHETKHVVHQGDARDLSWIPDASVHLIITSPPYWTLKEYRDHPGQLGHIEDYERSGAGKLNTAISE
jgi:hypothetical protein